MKLPQNRLIRIGLAAGGLIVIIGTINAFRGLTKPGPAAVDINDVASNAYQQGKQQGQEQGTAEGYDKGKQAGARAAIVPTIGDTEQVAEAARSESVRNALHAFNQMLCSRRNQYVIAAQSQKESSPAVWLRSQLRLQIDDFKDLTIRYDLLTGTAQQQDDSAHAIINHAAILQALDALEANKEIESCAVDLSIAHTTTANYLYQSHQAAQARQDALKQIDQQLDNLPRTERIGLKPGGEDASD